MTEREAPSKAPNKVMAEKAAEQENAEEGAEEATMAEATEHAKETTTATATTTKTTCSTYPLTHYYRSSVRRASQPTGRIARLATSRLASTPCRRRRHTHPDRSRTPSRSDHKPDQPKLEAADHDQASYRAGACASEGLAGGGAAACLTATAAAPSRSRASPRVCGAGERAGGSPTWRSASVRPPQRRTRLLPSAKRFASRADGRPGPKPRPPRRTAEAAASASYRRRAAPAPRQACEGLSPA